MHVCLHQRSPTCGSRHQVGLADKLPRVAQGLLKTTSHRAKPPANDISTEEALKELRDDPDIKILKADKGNTFVIMDTVEYDSKVNCLLGNDVT